MRTHWSWKQKNRGRSTAATCILNCTGPRGSGAWAGTCCNGRMLDHLLSRKEQSSGLSRELGWMGGWHSPPLTNPHNGCPSRLFAKGGRQQFENREYTNDV